MQPRVSRERVEALLKGTSVHGRPRDQTVGGATMSDICADLLDYHQLCRPDRQRVTNAPELVSAEVVPLEDK